MIGSFRSELLKVTSTRLLLGMIIGALAFTALAVVATIFSAGSQGTPTLEDPAMVRGVFSSMGSGTVFALILGVIAMTTEFRHMTVTSTFLAEPRRGHVVVAKMMAQAIFGALLAVSCILLTIGLALILLPLKDHAPVEWDFVAQVAAGSLLTFALFAVIGVAVGALVRNQIAAILATVVWVLLVEQLLTAFLPKVGKWLPGGAANGILQAAGFDASTNSLTPSPFLPVWGATLLLIGYALAFAGLAAATTLRRDVS